MEKFIGSIGLVIGGLALFGVAVFLFAFVNQWAWNHFMPAIFGLPTITWTQAFALGILAGIFKTHASYTKKD